jgi:hypothetical protein
MQTVFRCRASSDYETEDNQHCRDVSFVAEHFVD